MFTGIIETIGTIKAIRPKAKDVELDIDSAMDLSADQLGDSVAINGVCLTMTAKHGSVFTALASQETLKRSNLGELHPGSKVNVERALTLSSRLGGHIVSGHVDCMAPILRVQKVGESIRITVALDREFQRYVIEKGSITVDGTSLTVNDVKSDSFEVNIIPHTAQGTSLTLKGPGDRVNLEFDIIGKYVEKLLDKGDGGGLNDLLKKQGFM